jgi:hypothetical protein
VPVDIFLEAAHNRADEVLQLVHDSRGFVQILKTFAFNSSVPNNNVFAAASRRVDWFLRSAKILDVVQAAYCYAKANQPAPAVFEFLDRRGDELVAGLVGNAKKDKGKLAAHACWAFQAMCTKPPMVFLAALDRDAATFVNICTSQGLSLMARTFEWFKFPAASFFREAGRAASRIFREFVGNVDFNGAVDMAMFVKAATRVVLDHRLPVEDELGMLFDELHNVHGRWFVENADALSLSWALEALARGPKPYASMYNAVENRVTKVVEETKNSSEPAILGEILFAFARKCRRSDALFKAASGVADHFVRACEGAGDNGVDGMTRAVWACAFLDHDAPALFEEVDRAAPFIFERGSAAQIGIIVRAFGLAGKSAPNILGSLSEEKVDWIANKENTCVTDKTKWVVERNNKIARRGISLESAVARIRRHAGSSSPDAAELALQESLHPLLRLWYTSSPNPSLPPLRARHGAFPGERWALRDWGGWKDVYFLYLFETDQRPGGGDSGAGTREGSWI